MPWRRDATRVTRLVDFSPISRLFSLGSHKFGSRHCDLRKMNDEKCFYNKLQKLIKRST
jgi:hypothetical protein